jgi:hypothetical protein
MRTGSIVTTEEGTLDAAFATNKPPAPNVTATEAPIAAHRDRHNRRRFPLGMVSVRIAPPICVETPH